MNDNETPQWAQQILAALQAINDKLQIGPDYDADDAEFFRRVRELRVSQPRQTGPRSA